MRNKLIKPILLILCLSISASAQTELPRGLMLNLDFERAQEGLIPSKTLFPLYVPQDSLNINRFNYRNMLTFEKGQGLSIPHSTLLEPDGSEWIMSIRAFIVSDGLIISQGNDQHGYAVFVKDHTIQAVLRSGNVAYTLKEGERLGISKYRKKWVTIELRIKQDRAYLSLNRNRVAMVKLDAPLKGRDMHIRLGTHTSLPTVLKNKSDMTKAGFTGAITSLKIIRQ